MKFPTLAVVPCNHQDNLKIKASISGITFLKGEAQYRTRYTGNKFSAVDINGKLWVKASELKKQKELDYWKMKGKPVPKKKKKSPVETGEVILQYFNDETNASNENLSTEQNKAGTELQELSTKKTYSVNKKEVRQRILGFMNTQRGKKELYFFTVTFPKGTADHIAYQAYNTWLTSLRQYRILKNYIWVAERQENGTVHFHIAVPHKMPVKKINAMMAGTLKKFAAKNLIPFSVYQCRKYNGVDIAKNRKTRKVVNFAVKKGSKALVTYLTKYVTKNDTGFSHLAWHNSRGYSSIFTGVTFTIPEFNSRFKFRNYLHRDRSKWFENDYFFFAPWGDWGPPPELETHLFQVNSMLQELLN